MNSTRHTLVSFSLAAIALGGAGCGLSNDFYAELEEPGICKTVSDVPMDATQPGATLIKQLDIPLTSNIPLFDTSSGNVVVKLLSVTFTGKSGIQDFNSVDTASMSAIPDPANTSGLQPTQLITYTKAPGVTPGLTLTIAGDSTVDVVPFLTQSGSLTIQAEMSGGLPNNTWTADIEGCLYAKARIKYLQAYGLHF